MIDKEKVRELTNKYVDLEDLGTRLVNLIGNSVIQIIANYYGYESLDDLIENDDVSDEDFDALLEVIKECLGEAVLDALS